MALEAERETASFDPETLTQILDGGRTEKKRWLRGIIESDEIFSNSPNNYLHRTDRYKRALAKSVRARQLEEQLNLSEEDAIIMRSCICDDLPTTLHTLMFIPGLLSIFDDEQQKYWVPLAQAYKVIGCYAQTEVGHGSNIRALQTTATYLPDTDEFEMRTPFLEAFKWWPGTLGRTANHALVVARLILPGGVDKGIHSFIVPLRSMDDHQLLPGVVTRDIGPKIAFNSMDNGCLELHGVRIPRRNMAMRFSRVERGGEYVVVPGVHSKTAYITMMQVRAFIVMHSARELSKACTIAIRYSAVRRQGYDESGSSEYKVLDYTTQQHRLLSLLASSVAFHFVGLEVLAKTMSTEAALRQGKGGKELAQLHLATSGYKAVCTRIAADGIEDCRKACGGHGYLSSSGLPELLGNFLQQCTVEGDNVVLAQQAGAVLLKSFAKLMSGDSLEGGECAYFQTALDDLAAKEDGSAAVPEGAWRDPTALLRLYAKRSVAMVRQLAERMHKLMMEEGKSQGQAWMICQVDIVAVARGHAMFSILRCFTEALDNLRASRADKQVLAVLDRLRALFALYWLTMDLADFLEHGLVNATEARAVRKEVIVLLKEVRPDAVALTDSFDWSDAELKSVLGRKDGRVYEALLESAKRDPLNAKDPVDGYLDIVKPLRALRARM